MDEEFEEALNRTEFQVRFFILEISYSDDEFTETHSMVMEYYQFIERLAENQQAGVGISFWIFPPPACWDTQTRETHLAVRRSSRDALFWCKKTEKSVLRRADW